MQSKQGGLKMISPPMTRYYRAGLPQPVFDSGSVGVASGKTVEPGAESDSLWCGECEDTPAAVRCDHCDIIFCRPCYSARHRRGGKRMPHTSTSVETEAVRVPAATDEASAAAAASAAV